jgi:DNA transformation protein
MAVSSSFRTFVLDQLTRALPRIRSRSMFGGVGVYSDDHFFALIANDVLYFKVDDGNRGDFVARGMGPFRPFGESGEVMQYYQLPDDILEDVDALKTWGDAAVAVARRKPKSQSKRASPK